MHVVREHHCRPYEHAALQLHAIPNGGEVLDGDGIADHCAGFHITMIADDAGSSDHDASKHVRECPDLGAGTDVLTFHKRSGVNPHSHRPTCPGWRWWG